MCSQMSEIALTRPGGHVAQRGRRSAFAAWMTAAAGQRHRGRRNCAVSLAFKRVMPKRNALVVGVLWIATIGLSPSPSPASRRGTACLNAGLTTVALTSRVRVYDRSDQQEYACDLRTGRTTHLGYAQSAGGKPADLPVVIYVHAAGRFVVYVPPATDNSGADHPVRLDVSSGRTVSYVNGCMPTPSSMGGGGPGVLGLGVDSSGSTAWLCSGDRLRVVKQDRRGYGVLASWPIDDHTPTLTVHRSLVIWTYAGTTYTHHLAG